MMRGLLTTTAIFSAVLLLACRSGSNTRLTLSDGRDAHGKDIEVFAEGGEDGPIVIDLSSHLDAQAAAADLVLTEQQVASGTFSYATAVVTYDPQGHANHLAPGQDETVLASFRLSDSAGHQTALIRATIVLHGENDAPHAVALERDVQAGVFVTIEASQLFGDVDDGDLVSITAIGPGTPAGATTQLNHGQAQFSTNVGGDYQLGVTGTDSHGGSVTSTVVIHARQLTLTSSHARIVKGQDVTVNWTTANTNACTLHDGSALVSSELHGSVTLTPTAAVELALECNGVSTSISLPWQPAIFVDASAPSGGDGTRWEAAFNSVADAVAAAGGQPVELWFKGGAYYASGRAPVLTASPGLTVRGGYQADNTAWQDARVAPNAITGRTVFSGGSSALDFDPNDNSFHVVVAASGVTFDRLTIVAGRANGSGDDARGAGIFVGDAGTVVLQDSEVSANWAETPLNTEAWGGGIYVAAGSLRIRGAQINYNEARGGTNGDAYGGCLAVNGGSVTIDASPVTTFNDCRVVGGAGSNQYRPHFGFPTAAEPGAHAHGGAIAASGATLSVAAATFVTCVATGGAGGNGRKRDFPPSDGGSGAAGGDGMGGAIFLLASTFVGDNLTATNNMSKGGDGGIAFSGDCGLDSPCSMAGGNAGAGGWGRGGFLAASTSTVVITASAVSMNGANGGAGKSGGNADCGTSCGAAANGGNSGAGGSGEGGGLRFASCGTVDLSSSSITGNHANYGEGGGSGGSAVNGGTPGSAGGNGSLRGNDVYRFATAVTGSPTIGSELVEN